MKRRSRILLGTLAVCIAGGVAVALVLPTVARSRILAALHEAGYPAATLATVHLGWSSATVEGFSLTGDDRLRIARMEAQWTWRRLLGGRVDAVVVSGLSAALDVGPQGPDLTPFLPAHSAAPASAPPAAASGWPHEVPVGRVILEDSRIVLRHGPLQEQLALTATATDLGGGAAQLTLSTSGSIGSIALAGTVGPAAQDLRLDLHDLALTRCAALVGREGLPPLSASGRIRWDGTAQVALELTAPSGQAALAGTWHAAPGEPLGVSAGTVHCQQLDLATALAAAQPWLPVLPVSGLGGTAVGDLAVASAGSTWSVAGALTISTVTASHPRGAITAKSIAWSGRAVSSADGPRVTGAVTITGGEVRLAALAPLPALTITVPDAVVSSDGQRWLGRVRAACNGADVSVDGEADGSLSQLACRFRANSIALAEWLERLHIQVPVQVAGTASANGHASCLGGAWSCQATLDVEQATIADPGMQWRVAASHLSADGEATWLAGTPLHARAVLTLADTSIAAPGVGVTISGLAGTFPWALGEDPGLSGDLTGTIAAHGLTVPVRLRAHLIDQTLRGRAEVRLFDLLTANADGTVSFLPNDLRAQLALELPYTVVSDAAPLIKLVPALSGTTLSGALSASGAVTLAGGVVTPRMHVELSNGVIARPADNLRAEGVDVAAELTGLTPPSTAPLQTFSIRSLSSKDQHAERCDGWYQFTDGKLLLHQIGLDWAGGRIGCPDAVIDLANHTATGDFCATRISLADLLAVLAPGKLTGGGQLSARLPVVLDWAEPHVQLGNGFLRADPPEGWLRITDRTQVAAWIGSGGMVDASLRTQVVDAVRDFSFNQFEAVTSRPADGNLLTKVTVAGVGRTGPNPLELGSLTFNIRGVEAALDQVLRLQRSPPPKADDTLDRFFDN